MILTGRWLFQLAWPRSSLIFFGLEVIFWPKPQVPQTPSAQLRAQATGQSWALPVFFYFFNNKKWFFCTFYKINNLFLHQSYLKTPTPSQISLIKNARSHFLLLKKYLKKPKVPSSGLSIRFCRPKIWSTLISSFCVCVLTSSTRIFKKNRDVLWLKIKIWPLDIIGSESLRLYTSNVGRTQRLMSCAVSSGPAVFFWQI